MLVGICQVELFLPSSGSLKDKRAVVKSLVTRIKNRFNVSVAETENNDKWQRASIGMAVVSNENALINSIFAKIIALIEENDLAEIIEHKVEVV